LLIRATRARASSRRGMLDPIVRIRLMGPPY
jgi:hypothetical protein